MKVQAQQLLLTLFFALFASATFAAETYDEGIDYHRVGNGAFEQDKIEVVEFFSYACPHCNSFEPHINNWKKSKPANAELIRIPVVFRKSWEDLAKAYYTAEALDVLDQVHPQIFNLIHGPKPNKRPSKADIKKIFEQAGVAGEDFENTFNSFLVFNKVRRGIALTQKYGINGVPALVVGQSYRVEAGGSYGKMLGTTNFLIEQGF